MKLNLHTIFVCVALFMGSIVASAQQVNTLYFLENAPMRHSINPAFQPVQEFYMAFPIIGYTSFWAGNYDLTLSDWIYKDPSGKTITALHPDGKEHWTTLPNMLTLNEDATINLFSLGWQVRERGFFHINASERITSSLAIPKSIFNNQLNQHINLNESRNLLSTSMYAEVAFGYSHYINEQWSFGIKAKLLLGHGYMRGVFNKFNFTSSADAVNLKFLNHIGLSPVKR